MITQQKNIQIAKMIGWVYVSSLDVNSGKYHKTILAGWYSKIPKVLNRKINYNFYKGRSHNDLNFNFDANWQFEAIDWVEKQKYSVAIFDRECIIEVLGTGGDIPVAIKHNTKKEAIFEALYQFSIYLKNQ